MSLDSVSTEYLAAIEVELKSTLEFVKKNEYSQYNELHEMLAFHMGWEKETNSSSAGGKRIRPLLTLLSTEASGGEWEHALPAAAAVELVHNFSLIHDDIEDNSPLRRGRPTLWSKWGIAQAINAGDAMLSLAHIAMLNLYAITDEVTTIRANKILQNTCLHLTKGQFLDLTYQSQRKTTLESYWPMVAGKTAALISASAELGALISGCVQETIENYKMFGHYLGLAFQVQDDLLGIWGNTTDTGKSVKSDLASGKKSLPVLFCLDNPGNFAEHWKQGINNEKDIKHLADLLEREGALKYTRETASNLTNKALDYLDKAKPTGEAGKTISYLTSILLDRYK